MFCCRKLNGPDFGPTSQERDVDAYQPTAPPLEENAEDCWRRAHQASPMVTGPSFLIIIFSVADPWQFGVDPDPAIFVIDLQDANKKLIF